MIAFFKKNLCITLLFLIVNFSFGGKNIKPTQALNEAQKKDLYKKQISQKRAEYLITRLEDIFQREHYAPKAIDDTLSAHLFDQFLKTIDGEKSIFFKSDIIHLSQYKYQLDNLIKNKKIDFIEIVDSIYNTRINTIQQTCDSILSNPFNFYTNEHVIVDEDSIDYPANKKEQYQRWYLKMKYMVLQRFAEQIELREKNTLIDSITKKRIAKDTNFVIKEDTAIEKTERQRVDKIMKKILLRYKKRFDVNEKVNLFLNDLAMYMDPHTNYLPPLEKRSFDEGMTKKFYGIGALLSEEDGTGMKILNIITGGAAWKSKEIEKGDIIIKVGEGEAEYIDIAGFEIEEAVRLIRGKDKTLVRLTIKKPSGLIKEIRLIREEVKDDERVAKSAIITEKNKKVGYIYLPDFYSDFGNREGAQSAIDMAYEIEKLNNEKVDGIILDLRNNGGGSLLDVVQILGYFIADGPVVQVKDKHNNIRVLDDQFKWVLYTGPLVVMVNQFSASASEIFAAAVQDYQRGIVIGTKSTYGKGTVQKETNINMPNNWTDTTIKEFGGAKITIQKFYRINGGSTQKKGVIPDIIFPDRTDYLKILEADSKNVMPWDEIKQTNYKIWNYNAFDIKNLAQSMQAQIDTMPNFIKIKEHTLWLHNNENQKRQLHIEKYQEQEKLFKSKLAAIDSVFNSVKDSMNVEIVPIDKTKYKDAEKIERQDKWIKALKTDFYLKHTVNLMHKMLTPYSK